MSLTHPDLATILVLDDDVTVLAVTAKMLERAGFRVLRASAANVVLALCRAHREPIHLALLDLVMPLLTVSELRQCLLNEFPGILVMYMSGFPYEEVASRGISAKITDFIQKPFTFTTLVDRLTTALARRDVPVLA